VGEFLWVTNTEENREYYSDCAVDGLRLHFDREIAPSLKMELVRFVRYLRHDFYFPIRCHVYFKAKKAFASQKKGKTCLGIFYDNASYKKRYPQIFIASELMEGESVCEIFATLCQELTHYFQWYFLCDERQTDRGLEIQAAKYADRIVSDYLWFIGN
jgi:hypothetical protein